MTPTHKSSLRPRRWLRYSLRTLLIGVAAICIILAVWVVPSERQRRAVAAIRDSAGFVAYDYEIDAYNEDDEDDEDDVPFPEWASDLLGIDYFAEPVLVHFMSDSTDADLANVGVLSDLEALVINATEHVTDAGLNHLSGLTRLKILFLGFPVSDAGLSRLRRLTALEELTLGGPIIGNDSMLRLSKMLRLRELSLDHTNVGDEGLKNLAGLTNLEFFSLRGTNVTDRGLAHLTNLRRLWALDLSDTQVTDQGCEKLQLALPECEIER